MKKVLVLGLLLVFSHELGAVIAPQTTSTWTQPISGCASPLTCTYNIYRGPDVGQEVLIKGGINALQFVDTSVTRGNKYCYKVTASNIYGEGGFSIERCLVIPTVPTPPGNFKVVSS